jgi:8-oxo-dGTP pyrophosphatase MutT (NUDIX family)
MVQAAGAIVLHRDENGELRVVVIKRGRPPRLGAWTLPGGRVDPGETPAEAARREVREETGLEVNVLRETEIYTYRAGPSAGDPLHPYVIHEHLCVVVAGTLTAGDDAAEARWVTLPDLAALGVHEDARAVIERAAAIIASAVRRKRSRGSDFGGESTSEARREGREPLQNRG